MKTPDIETYEFSRVVQQDDSLQVIRVENDLAIYKLLVTHSLKGRKKGRPKFKAAEPRSSQGIVTSKQLKDYLSGKCGLGGIEFDLVSSKTLEGLRSRGWHYGQEERLEWVLSDPFDVVSSGADCHVVKFLHDCHMLEDSAGAKLPVGIHFGYIEARMDNCTYDLDKAVAILKKNPNIEFTYARPGSGGIYGEPPDPIQRMPYYQQSPASYYLSFWWAPPADDYCKMWEKCVSFGGEYPSTHKERAVWELDLLGLRKGGAAKFDDFYGGSS
jgi:hypothetical protein